jgi:hypothetical protein
MECDTYRTLLVEKQEGTISSDNKEILERHLLTCDRCAEDFALIGASFDALRGARDEEAPTHYFTNLLPRIRRRIENQPRTFAGLAMPVWAQRFLAPGSALAVLGCIVGLYILLLPSFDPSKMGLREIVAEVPREDIDRVTESVLYSNVLTRTMEPSQRMLETLPNPAIVSQHIERELVDDQLKHGHSLSVFLAGDSPYEDIADEDIDSIIMKLNQTSL